MNFSPEDTPDDIVRKLGGIAEADLFFKTNPQAAGMRPDVIFAIMRMKLYAEEKAKTNQYILEGLKDILGYFPNEEQLEAFSQEGRLSMEENPPNTQYTKIWMFDNHLVLARLPMTQYPDGKIQFNFVRRNAGKTTYTFGTEQFN